LKEPGVRDEVTLVWQLQEARKLARKEAERISEEINGKSDKEAMKTLEGLLSNHPQWGKLINLENLLREQPLTGTIGIGHTRWATHGLPTEGNAHPIATDRVAVVHNGIIENFQALKRELVGLGYRFHTQTDTEAVAILATHHLAQGLTPAQAVAHTLERLEGAFALVFLFAGEHDLLICARRGSPLAIGYGDGEMFVGSDALALAPLTRRLTYLEEGDWAVVTSAKVTIFDRANNKVARAVRETALSGALIGKGNYRHFMQKEIFEQPAVIGDTLHALFNPTTRSVNLGALPFDLAALSKVTIIACGTSFHAAMVGKHLIESLAQLPCEIDLASEFRYRDVVIGPSDLVFAISQSGETADTLAALRDCTRKGQPTLAICNGVGSSIARAANGGIYLHAGPEIGVASTKAFSCQILVLAMLALYLGRLRSLSSAQGTRMIGELRAGFGPQTDP
jgi:glucosamine--fructose-6-phosphate aminotransferase (isomerizing)